MRTTMLIKSRDCIQLRQEIIYVAQQLYNKNLLAAADGNISYRINDEEILITPTGKAKARLQPEDMAVITIQNQIKSGHPSSECLMHLSIYQQCAAARCVIHAHPPKAIAWTIARPDLTELPSNCLSELILATGRVPIVPYSRPGTQAMGDMLTPYLPDCRIMLLARHGALTWGEDLQETLNGMERLEHTAEILLHTIALGGITNLPDEEIAALKLMRSRMGNQIR